MDIRRTILTALILAIIHVVLVSQSNARTIFVGPERAVKLPSEAAIAANDGDTIEIEPRAGGYHDCAIWRQNNLEIRGTGGTVLLAGTTCRGQAIFVVEGHDTVIRNLSFGGAKVPDGNGAGIRQIGTNLRVFHSRFIDNEDGILAGSNADSTISVADSTFIGNGACIVSTGCAHGIYVGRVAMLRVQGSIFRETQHGHHIKSRALRTEITNNIIEDGPTGTSSYLIDISNGGMVIIQNNVLEKGPNTDNPNCAIAIAMEGVKNPTQAILVAGNRFTSHVRRRTIFVANAASILPDMIGNTIGGDAIPLSMNAGACR